MSNTGPVFRTPLGHRMALPGGPMIRKGIYFALFIIGAVALIVLLYGILTASNGNQIAVTNTDSQTVADPFKQNPVGEATPTPTALPMDQATDDKGEGTGNAQPTETPAQQHQHKMETAYFAAMEAARNAPMVSESSNHQGGTPAAPGGNAQAEGPPRTVPASVSRGQQAGQFAPPDPMALAKLLHAQGGGGAGSNSADRKVEWLAEHDKSSDPYLHERLIAGSEYELKAGQVIPCTGDVAVNTDLPGKLLCLVRSNVYDYVTGTHLLVPQGAKITEEYGSNTVAYGDARILVASNRLIYPKTGASIAIPGMSTTDVEGATGLPAEVDNHWKPIILGAMLSAMLNVGAQVAQGPTFGTLNPSNGQLFVQGFTGTVNNAGQQIVSRAISLQPTLKVLKGQRFAITLTKDIQLPEFTAM